MSYALPKSFAPLREFMRGQGVDVKHLASARQAAFVAQQLLGTRIRFPPQGEDMTSTLLLIQGEVEAGRTLAARAPQLPEKHQRTGSRSLARQADHVANFTPEVFVYGFHIFCDGAAIPNPGAGGWGVVVYADGQEMASACGGDPATTTNNQMELTGLLNAITEARKLVSDYGAINIWCDNEYCVKGTNEWMPIWKSKGWSKRRPNSPKREGGEIKNIDLWRAIDVALDGNGGRIVIRWVKGHIGVAGNERADELAEQGRIEASAAFEVLRTDAAVG
ncbi:ribonuclease HI [Rhizobium sp. PP-WC-2G-219]|nr:ribonuclease HI [Rhizobium sp. PP-WC-2G-219]